MSAPAVLQLNLTSALEDSDIAVGRETQGVPKTHRRLHLWATSINQQVSLDNDHGLNETTFESKRLASTSLCVRKKIVVVTSTVIIVLIEKCVLHHYYHCY